MWIGWLEFDILLGDVHSLKQKRSLVRPLIAELRRKYDVTVAEVDHADLHRRALIGVAIVSGDSKHAIDVLDKVESFVADRPEVTLLAARRGMTHSND